MAKTALDLTNEEIAHYRATERQRQAQAEQARRQRLECARAVAQRAANLLKSQFGAKRVVLFGSVARGNFFHPRSDIDLAVEGIEDRDFWRAWSALDEVTEGFEIDLVSLETIPDKLREQIDQEGVEL